MATAASDSYTLAEDQVFVPTGSPLISANFNAGAEGWTYADDTFGTSNPNNAAGSVNLTRGVGGSGCLLVDIGRRTGPPRSTSGAFSRAVNLATGATVQIALSYRLRVGNPAYSGLTQRYGEAVLTIDGIRYGDGQGDSLERLIPDSTEADMDSDWQQTTFNIPLKSPAISTHGTKHPPPLSTPSSPLPTASKHGAPATPSPSSRDNAATSG